MTDDGKLLAYGLAVAGSDWQEWKVRDIETGKDLGDDVKWVKFSNGSWKQDGERIFLQPLRRSGLGRAATSKRIIFTNSTSTNSERRSRTTS